MKVGFIGIGRMGNHMARHLAEKGHEVQVFDVVPTAADHLREIPGIKVVNSVTEAARRRRVVGTSLPGPREVETVVMSAGGLLETRSRAQPTSTFRPTP
jgi:3-hydroxyisobutyrate dehydrogenase